MKKNKAAHLFWMRCALRLAARGRYQTSPNPMVGACVVKSGKLIAEGFHQVYGGDHAEVIALKRAGKKARGAALYVTLEPCSTWGKTPPCAGAILESGIKEVIVGALDPNPRHRGRGVEVLRKAGVKVVSGILADEVKIQNQAFFKWVSSRTPFVSLKMAQSLDGKIATHTGHSRWITSKPARQWVHQLRAEQDAILVGTGTLKNDNPLLSPRSNGLKLREGRPWRVVLDPRFEISPKARVFQGNQLTILAVSEKIVRSKRLAKKNAPSCMVLPVREKNGRLELKDLLRKLASLGVAKLLVEGGGELTWSFFSEKLADKFFWLIAPKFIGGRDAKTSVEGDGVPFADKAFASRIEKCSRIGDDLLIEGRPR